MKRKLVGILILLVQIAAAELPYAEHGWTKEEAAAHLLSRFSYGARPGEVDRVAAMGLESWLERQLQARQPDRALKRELANLPPAWEMDNKELAKVYPQPSKLKKMLLENGYVKEDGKPDRRKGRQFLEDKGFRPPRELLVTLFGQRLLHARHSENTLKEVLTDFWFNHFNVAVSNNQARRHILAYERDVIRPNALGKFRELLGATAKHPAMLLYLDNARSTANKDQPTTADARLNDTAMNPQRREKIQKRLKKRKKGLNENYARELMELHTLGVDGGYTQKDVEEVARAFTGWTLMRPRFGKMLKKQAQMSESMGVLHQGDFLFAAMVHDAGTKKILGHEFAAGGGVEEGERVLDILTAHPSTARHVAQKLAVRFICDEPDERDIREIARSFRTSGGDVKAVMRALARTDGFWDRKNSNAKVKTPFELVISANRALDGELYPSRQLYGWLAKMGHPLYNYQAPTGFPDEADFWVSSATVLNRVNFGLHAARGGVPGFAYPLGPPMSVKKALDTLMPQKFTSKTESSVTKLLEDSPNLKLERVSNFQVRPNLGGRYTGADIPRMFVKKEQQKTATLVGLIIGTPEFQRR